MINKPNNNIRTSNQETRPDTRHKMRLVNVLFTFENNAEPTDGPTDRPTDGRTDGHNLILRCNGASKNGITLERFEISA